MNELFFLSDCKRPIRLMANEALFICVGPVIVALITYELPYLIGDEIFFGAEIIAAPMGLTMAFGAY